METSTSADQVAAKSPGAGRTYAKRDSLRVFNERLATATDAARRGVAFLVCECGRDDCSEAVEIDFLEYESVRTYQAQFLVAPGHEEGAHVLAKSSRAVVIEAGPDLQNPGRDGAGTATEEGPVRRVLVVDDDASVRLICSVNLEAAGFTVLEASDGREGLERARSERPDLVLTDVAMPRLDGFGLAEALRQHEHTRDIPVAFMTGYPEQSYASRARALGALAFLQKPFDPAALVSVALRAFV